MSRPRAATSVASKIAGEEGVAIEVANAASVLVLAAGGRCPCKEYSVAPGKKGERI